MIQSIYIRILTKTTLLKHQERTSLKTALIYFHQVLLHLDVTYFQNWAWLVSFCLKHDAIYLKYGFLIYLKNQLKKAKTDRDFDTISDEHIIFLYIICKKLLSIVYDWEKCECSKSSHRRDTEVHVRIHCYKQII